MGAVSLVSTLFIPLFATATSLAITMLMLVTRDIRSVVPTVLHKIDPLAAGVRYALDASGLAAYPLPARILVVLFDTNVAPDRGYAFRLMRN